jgi:1-acyl-sn-glycerol-3-phosphate acyltransferase
MNFFAWVPWFFQTLMWLVARPLLFVFSGLRISGKENLKGLRGNAIIAMNHVSQLDPIMIPATLGPLSPLMPVFSVAREKEFYQGIKGVGKYIYGGFVFRALGAHPIILVSGDYERSLKPHIDILEKGGSLGIFPEGRRTKDGTIGEARAGVAYLLWRTGVPVVPVVFHGHYQMKPRHFFSRRHAISVVYGKPFYKEDFFGPETELVPPTKEEFKEVAQKIMLRIREIYEKN